ncbi:putative MFS-type transporter [Cyphellophora attinorum]|uniref:Putative MFS-type transporter n=1 Tax=Cyphellophora attinorum TaxID=1664694 RepID=A0A0N0NN70_9EURO|nr:putative MFS-type transporter [Phialophora attinorum]KPI41281.1 putative MFS-type transporter [Phialophora attinorum]
MANSDSVPGLLPPGTVHLLHVHGTSRSSDELILVPKPSAHPDDPLNWSKSRKILHAALVYLYTFTTGVGGTSTYSILTDMSRDTGLTLTQLNLGTAFIFLLAGWGNLIWQPLALAYGRRPVYLLSTLGVVAVSEWTAHINNFGQWAAARILFGFFVAPVEVLPEISIPDIFFAHERGSYIGGYSMTLAGSNFIAPFIAGFMNDSIGWRWVQLWCAILLALNFVLAFFFQEESSWHRDEVEAETASGDADVRLGETAGVQGDPEKMTTTAEPVAANLSPTVTAGQTFTRKTYAQKLALWTNNHLSRTQIMRIVWRPFLILIHFPNILFAGFLYAFTNSWYSVYNATASLILSSPPYNMSAAMVGVTYLAPLLGAIIGGIVAGPLSDRFTLFLAHRNNGIREPEQRLWGVITYTACLTIGLLMWGVGAAHSAPLGVLLFGSVLCGFGIVTGGSYAITYAVDCYKEIAGETIVSLIIVRNNMTFAFGYAITPWINASGLQNTFIAVSVICLVTGMSFLLMIWKGRALRISCEKRYWEYAASQLVKH